MITGHKSIIYGIKDSSDFAERWKKEHCELISTINQRKLKYLRIIFGKNGCKKVKEFVEKSDLRNIFFEIFNDNNYETIKSDARNLTEKNFINKYL